MKKKAAPPVRPEKDRVWIELDKPIDDAHAEEICKKANRMLARMGSSGGRGFFWSPSRQQYGYGDGMGHIGLPDRGDWFNLDYLGREA